MVAFREVVIFPPINVKWGRLNKDPIKLFAGNPDASAFRAIVDLNSAAIGWPKLDVANRAIHFVASTLLWNLVASIRSEMPETST